MIRTIARNSLLPLIAFIGFGLGFLLMMTGCQTMNGAGKDIEHAGEKIQEKASK